MSVLARFSIASFSLVALACASPTAPERLSRDTAAPRPMLPAYPLPGERMGAAKGDEFDQLRASNPDVFGITAAPSTAVRAPAQFEPHQQLLIGWTGAFPETVVPIITNTRAVVEVVVVHEGAASRQSLVQALADVGANTGGLQFVDMELDSIWMRDYGPLSIVSEGGEVAFVDPRYYHGRPYDDAIPSRLASRMGITSYRQPLAWEGGTYVSDGKGRCVYSQGVYWYGGAPQETIHAYQKAYLGCTQNTVVQPLADEGTTHTDMFAKLVDEDTMLVGRYSSAQDPGNASILNQNAQLLDAAGFDVVRLPMPSNDARRVWRTYANSLMINGRNLIPVYADDRQHEDEALGVWQSVRPDMHHVPIDSTGLIQWSGAIHCITMTVPEGALSPIEAPALLCGGSHDCTPIDVTPTGTVDLVPSPSTGSTTGSTSCAQLGYEGCCDGNRVTWCENDEIKSQVCQSCGWNAGNGWYDCGASGADPSGTHPLSCGGSTPETPVEPTPALPTDPVTTEPAAGCGTLQYEGCCDGERLTWCQGDRVETLDCDGFGCGWDATKGYYDCNQTGAGPASFPLTCPAL